MEIERRWPQLSATLEGEADADNFSALSAYARARVYRRDDNSYFVHANSVFTDSGVRSALRTWSALAPILEVPPGEGLGSRLTATTLQALDRSSFMDSGVSPTLSNAELRKDEVIASIAVHRERRGILLVPNEEQSFVVETNRLGERIAEALAPGAK